MPDDDDDLAVLVRDGTHVFGRCAGRQPLVDLRLAERERGRRLARAKQRAADDCIRGEPVGVQLLAESAGAHTAVGGQRAELVGIARCRLGVSNDHEAHPSQDNLARMDDLWERYLLLGLRLGRHIEGLVDAYFGPTALKERVEGTQPAPPAELVAEAAALAERTDSRWLRAQLAGCETTARRLAGEEIAWVDEVERCYGVRPRRTDESLFEAAHDRLDAALPGDGDLGDRYRTWSEQQELPADALLQASARFADALRTRTAERFGLPDDEAAAIELVRNEPWAAFNYYLGRRRSRVVVNTDLPVHSFRLPGLVAHEIYPGHHTEHAWKEQLLVDGEGNYGEAIFLVGTPQSTVSEGIASLAGEMVGAYDDAQSVYDELGIEYDAATADAVREAREDLDGVAVNAALLLHEDGLARDEVVDYVERWALGPRDSAEKRVEFITHPTWRAYISCYSSGYELCKRWVNGDAQRFRRLLTEQLTTADLLR